MTHTDTGRLQCPTCNRDFDSEHGLRVHSSRAHGEGGATLAWKERSDTAFAQKMRLAAAAPDLIDGIKRRIGTALNNRDASAEWLLNHIRGMQRFVIEWERRADTAGGKT